MPFKVMTFLLPSGVLLGVFYKCYMLSIVSLLLCYHFRCEHGGKLIVLVLPHSEKVPGSNPDSDFSVFACFPRACVGFLQVTPKVQTLAC